MVEPTREVLDVVRARRVEVVDDEDRVRLVLGEMGDGVAGISVRSAEGRERASLLVHDTGVSLAFKADGDEVLVLGVIDHVPAAGDPGAFIVLCDVDGAPVLRWQVEPDGNVRVDRTGDVDE